MHVICVGPWTGLEWRGSPSRCAGTTQGTTPDQLDPAHTLPQRDPTSPKPNPSKCNLG